MTLSKPLLARALGGLVLAASGARASESAPAPATTLDMKVPTLKLAAVRTP